MIIQQALIPYVLIQPLSVCTCVYKADGFGEAMYLIMYYLIY